MKFFGLFALLLFLASPLEAQDWEFGLYHQRVAKSDSLGNDLGSINNYIDTWAKVRGRTGVWGFAYSETGYSSLVGGLYYDFTNWFELGLGAGLESVSGEEKKGERYAAFLLLFSGRTCTLEAYYERGRVVANPWHQADLLCRPVDGIALGIFSQRFVGTGPRIVLTLTDKIPLQLWLSPFMYDNETKTSSKALGVQLVFRDKR